MTNLFLQALTRRSATYSRCEISSLVCAATRKRRNIGVERLDDKLTNLMEGMAGIGVNTSACDSCGVGPGGNSTFKLGTDYLVTFDKRRLDLYNITLGWLGGSLNVANKTGTLNSSSDCQRWSQCEMRYHRHNASFQAGDQDTIIPRACNQNLTE